jgi:hypothetical protein
MKNNNLQITLHFSFERYTLLNTFEIHSFASKGLHMLE